jgi:hypothetical protein
MASNKPIVTFLGCQFELIKLTMNANTSTNLQRSNVVIGDSHFNNASNTYKILVFSTKLGNTSSTYIFPKGMMKQRHNCNLNHRSHMLSTMQIGLFLAINKNIYHMNIRCCFSNGFMKSK